ncbi:MAG: inositol monophosphatase [Alphaproteobacteria bacterium]|jgi:fructose-1,6-bisphosphatase/inositol monophosphatase family enzyme|nr:inositol monophosphatase [Alphaproteobacteria bacterium]
MLPDPDRVIDIIREAAVEDVLPRFKSLADHEVMEKNPGDIVTIADLDAEHRMTRRLGELAPGSHIVGEEAVGKDPDVLDRLSAGEPLWLIDPVDGTRNFSNGNEPFAMVVAYIEGGETRIGWIHDPVAGETAVAVKGEGATYGGEPIKVAGPTSLDEMTGMINYTTLGQDLRDRLRARAEGFKDIRNWRCAGHDMTLLARGAKHFSIYRRLWAWDHAAGVLIHREAGGYSARVDGKPYRPTDRVEGLLMAPNEASWQEILDYLGRE